MEITGRSCLGAAKAKLGFDKLKVTCFKYKKSVHFKRECTNQQADKSVNPFRDDYYQKAIYHRISESPKMNQKQISKGSSKERRQALAVIQDDEGFKWNKYIPREKHVLVVAVDNSWQRHFARERINELYDPFDEAKEAKRWDAERECYLDPQ
ncbi:putative transcription factor interactor and regulator CCHC(Zn) family [Helianthus anomalus]